MEFFICAFSLIALKISLKHMFKNFTWLAYISVDLLHIIPFLVLFIENIFFTYELSWWEVVYPLGFTAIWFMHCLLRYYKYDVIIYPMLNFRSKNIWLWILVSPIMLTAFSFISLYSRNWINSAW